MKPTEIRKAWKNWQNEQRKEADEFISAVADAYILNGRRAGEEMLARKVAEITGCTYTEAMWTYTGGQ